MSEDLSIFREIDEALKVDKLEKFFARHGKTILFVCLGIIIITIINVVNKEYDKKVAARQTAIILQANHLVRNLSIKKQSIKYYKPKTVWNH